MFLWFESSLGLGTMSVQAAEADRSYLGLCCVYFHFRDTTQVARSLYTYRHIFGCNNLNIWSTSKCPNYSIYVLSEPSKIHSEVWLTPNIIWKEVCVITFNATIMVIVLGGFTVHSHRHFEHTKWPLWNKRNKAKERWHSGV